MCLVEIKTKRKKMRGRVRLTKVKMAVSPVKAEGHLKPCFGVLEEPNMLLYLLV